MKPMDEDREPTDTHPEIARMQARLLREAGGTRRFALAHALSRRTMIMARRASEREHPDLTEQEVARRFLESLYGEDLVRALIEASS